jgi:hypothetical protein
MTNAYFVGKRGVFVRFINYGALNGFHIASGVFLKL